MLVQAVPLADLLEQKVVTQMLSSRIVTVVELLISEVNGMVMSAVFWEV